MATYGDQSSFEKNERNFYLCVGVSNEQQKHYLNLKRYFNLLLQRLVP